MAQQQLPVIRATSDEAVIKDGNQVELNWHLDPKTRPDVYYVNVPHGNSKVTLRTDQGKLSFHTRFGKSYDCVVLLNNRDSCFVRIAATDDPSSVRYPQSGTPLPDTLPFTLHRSRIYLRGLVNGQKEVAVQLDLGAGTSCVNKNASDKLMLLFNAKTMVDNTQGVNESRTSQGNELSIGPVKWSDISLTEVGNMMADEDLIIGNALFRDRIIEIDYDKLILIIHEKLPAKAGEFRKQEVFYEQNRPKFMAEIIHGGESFRFWCLFDTGRDGSMLIGEDFTGINDNWDKLQPLQLIKGRKIVRVDARISGLLIKDVVTNAADPSKPAGRPTLFGNQILNHFNVILDNQRGMIYLKPNSRVGEPYSDYESYLKMVKK